MDFSILKFFSSKKKEIAVMSVSIAISLILAIAGLELYFQKRYWHSSGTQFDPELGWSAIPNKMTEKKGIRYTTNSLGFRSETVDSSRKQILVLGDSVVWGQGVQDNETVAAYLGNHFLDYQVLNMGVSGYGIDQYYLQLKQHISQLNPNIIVVVIFLGNDWGDFTKDTQYGKSKPLFKTDTSISHNELENRASFQVDQNKLVLTNSPVSQYSCSNLISRSWTLSLPLLQPVRDSLCTINKLNTREGIYVAIGLLLKIGSLAEEKKSELLFVLSPSKSDFYYDFKKQNYDELFKKYESNKSESYNKLSQSLFQNIFKQTQFPYLDFYEIIKKRGWKIEDLYLPGDNDHLSPLGLKYMAESIHNYFLNRSTINNTFDN